MTLEKESLSKKIFRDWTLKAKIINTLTVNEKIFINTSFKNSTFNEVIFVNCTFNNSSMLNIEFNDCHFKRCTFNDSNLTNCNYLQNTTITNCSFEKTKLISCKFDATKQLKNCTFKKIDFIGCGWYYIRTFKNLKFIDCTIDNSSISEVNGEKLQLHNCKIKNTNIEDCYFIKSTFINIKHDFDYNNKAGIKKEVLECIDNEFFASEGPMLCDFTDSKIRNTQLPDKFFIWNNTKETKIDYYNRIISLVSKSQNTSGLWALVVCADRLSENKPSNIEAIIQNVILIFKEKLRVEAQKQNYSAIGNIVENYALLPDKFKNAEPLIDYKPQLEAPKTNKQEKNKLTIIVTMNSWTVREFAKFQTKLSSIEAHLPNRKSLTITSIAKGSVLQTLTGEINSLIVLITSIAAVGVSTSVTYKNIKIGEKERLNAIKLENEIKHQEEELKNKLLLDKIEIKKGMLENEILTYSLTQNEEKLKEQKLKLINKIINELQNICLEDGFDLKKYLQSNQGKLLKKEVKQLHNSNPLIKAILTIE